MKFADYEVNDHVDYRIIIKDANNETWQVTARYRKLREIHQEIKDALKNEQLPEFPPRKIFGNLDPTFISQRQKALENYFNNLLRKYTLDQLEPLRKFLKEGRKDLDQSNKEADKDTGADNTQNNSRQGPGRTASVVDNKPAVDIGIDRIIENYKNHFFDLNDNYGPPDDEEIKKKSYLYQKYVKLDVGVVTGAYKLPAGMENNLLTIHDETLINNDANIGQLLENTLDNINNAVQSIQFLKNIEIIVNP